VILGWDLSGVVEAAGPGATKFKTGDEVYSRPDIARNGAYAEHIVVKEAEVAFKPISYSHIQAGAMPLACLTAWQALFDVAGLSADQKILIHGAAGGVGGFAVQLAKWKGAYVIGTASAGNQTYLRELGVDEPIDYGKTRFEDVVRGVEVVFDTVGGDTQRRSWMVLRKGGILVSIAAPPSPDEAAKSGVRQAFIFVTPNGRELTKIAELADSGKLKPVDETIMPLSEAREAHELIQTGHTRGKIVLVVV
jgi:NADPH:quinone reductase-like Zn-dependent oxidoreductase